MYTPKFEVKEHVIPCQYIREYPGATLENQEDTLQLHMKQYTPLDKSNLKPGAITIIAAHANGFPKELYEPLWEDLLKVLKERGQAIRGIWIADVAQQGASGVLNERKLGNDPSWNDHPRDLLHMINHFRKEMPRPLVGIGHSMGSAHLVNLSLMHPRLLASLVLIDPVIQNGSTAPQDPSRLLGRASTFRRDIWSSRSEAIVSMSKAKFYQSWDKRVLALWFKYGLRDLPTPLHSNTGDESEKSSSGDDDSKDDDSKDDGPPVTLTTTKHQEVFTFLRPNFDSLDENGNPVVDRLKRPDIDLNAEKIHPFYRPEPLATFKNLKPLRPGTLYIFGGKSPLSSPEWRKARIDRTGVGVGGSGGAKEGRVKEVILEEAGHLIPMEVVGECAEAAGKWLKDEMEKWRRMEEEFTREWEAMGKRERYTVSEEWKVRVGGDPRDGGKSSEKL